MSKDFAKIEDLLERIASALERRSPHPEAGAALAPAGADGFVWEAEEARLMPVSQGAALPLALLKGIDNSRDTLYENTRRFAAGLPANTALLWAARGMATSSLVTAVHAEANRQKPLAGRLAHLEIPPEDS